MGLAQAGRPIFFSQAEHFLRLANSALISCIEEPLRDTL